MIGTEHVLEHEDQHCNQSSYLAQYCYTPRSCRQAHGQVTLRRSADTPKKQAAVAVRVLYRPRPDLWVPKQQQLSVCTTVQHLGRGRDHALGYLLQLGLGQAEVIAQAQTVIVALKPPQLTHQLVTPQLLQQSKHLSSILSLNSSCGDTCWQACLLRQAAASC